MKKLMVLAVFGLFALNTAKAQSVEDQRGFGIGIGGELGIPSQSIYSIGLGGSLKLEVPVVHHFSITGSAGIMSMNYKSAIVSNFNTPNSDTFIPLKGGIKYSAGPGFYLQGELGEAIETAHDKRDLFAFSLGPGFIVPIAQGKSGVDISFRYESWSEHDLRQTALRVAYRFGW